MVTRDKKNKFRQCRTSARTSHAGPSQRTAALLASRQVSSTAVARARLPPRRGLPCAHQGKKGGEKRHGAGARPLVKLAAQAVPPDLQRIGAGAQCLATPRIKLPPSGPACRTRRLSGGWGLVGREAHDEPARPRIYLCGVSSPPCADHFCWDGTPIGCTLTFRNHSELQRHTRVHTGTRRA